MTSMGTAASREHAARWLAVLAVLLGLLAMHGLGSPHHAAAASGATHAALPAAATSPDDDAHAHHHRHAAAKPEVPHDAVALLGSPGASCDGACPDLAMLCVAVLAGAALALLLTRRRSCPALATPARPRDPARAPPVRHARGPDPVRELCVSRT